MFVAERPLKETPTLGQGGDNCKQAEGIQNYLTFLPDKHACFNDNLGLLHTRTTKSKCTVWLCTRFFSSELLPLFLQGRSAASSFPRPRLFLV